MSLIRRPSEFVPCCVCVCVRVGGKESFLRARNGAVGAESEGKHAGFGPQTCSSRFSCDLAF